jgi:aspartate-semialdehyde dehydrogenase
MKLAIVGVTGLVGKEMMEVLEERRLQISEFIPVASKKSAGRNIRFMDRDHKIVTLEEALKRKPDFALFSAGASLSLDFADRFAEIGCCVIDNSSAWRMHPDIKLVVPEVNGDILDADDKLIANPNCSTIQLVAALRPIHARYGLKRVVVSTYQSFTGTGARAVAQYRSELQGNSLDPEERAYPFEIFENCLPHCDIFLDNLYTKEEMKLVNETRKIMGIPKLALTATAVRVPVMGGHSESVNVELENEFELEELRHLISIEKGLILQDDVERNIYPMPKYVRKKDEVFVGRIRRDYSVPNAFNMWIVADNLRKGAATNSVQILQSILELQ